MVQRTQSDVGTVTLNLENKPNLNLLGLAPIAILPDYERRRIGSESPQKENLITHH